MRLLKWMFIIGFGALLAWWLLTAGQHQVNPDPPAKVKQMRVVA